MILSFTVANFRSISTPQTISFVASNLKEERAGISVKLGREIPAVLPCAVIYGANASGKSNIIRALRFMRSAVLSSQSKSEPDSIIPRVPFALNQDLLDDVSSFDLDFVVDGIRYSYGFECNDREFTAEWLYTYPEVRQRMLFERRDGEIVFGNSFRGSKKLLVDVMRPNSLFLSAATQNSHSELSKIASLFRNIAFVTDGLDFPQPTNFKISEDTIKFLSGLGTGIVAHREEDVDTPEHLRGLISDFAEAAKKHLGEHGSSFSSDLRRKELKLGHKSSSGEVVYFDLEDESSGTRRLLSYMTKVFDSLERGSMLVIDEMDLSLHTHAVETVIQFYLKSDINTNNAQLMATTHDTNLLGSKLLRRDEIWFVEKDSGGSSNFYPLSDIRSRPTDDFERGYLQGRFGAVPF